MGVMDPLLAFRGVSFAYPGRPGEAARAVLDGVDLALQPGDRVALVGPNGSGKTTLLHLAVGLLKPSAGEIEAFGEVRRTEKDFREVRGRAGLLFQDPEDQLFSPTVAEDVAFGPLNLGKSRDEALAATAETLASLDLEGYEERITHHLSYGEKRLVALASVLAMRPEVLLLDEPTDGLDEHYAGRLTEILGGLEQAMLVVSHDRAFLGRVTSRALLLSSGRLKAWTI